MIFEGSRICPHQREYVNSTKSHANLIPNPLRNGVFVLRYTGTFLTKTPRRICMHLVSRLMHNHSEKTRRQLLF